MISLSQIKKFKKFVFLAENQLLRKRFKITLKEIGKEKIILKFLKLFFQKSKIELYMAQIDPASSEMKNQVPKHVSNNLS